MGRNAFKRDSLNVVTRANFDKVLPHVMSALEEATFVTIDTELSGLCAFRSNRYSIFDDLPSRYAKLADSATNFALLQFGLGVFKWDEAKGQCTCSVFSFHLFPAVANNVSERKFTMQVSSIAFLAENGFDFNATFNEGIPYMSEAEEAAQRHRIDPSAGGADQSRDKHAMIELRKPEDIEYVKSVMERVDEWAQQGAVGKLELPPSNGYQRLLTYQQVEHKYGERFMLNKVNSTAGCYLTISAPSADQRDAIQAEEKEKALSKLKADIGFRLVIDKIIERQLPVIGHNCFLDICHVYEKFIGKMPSNVNDFKREVQRRFPLILDTKMLASEDKELTGSGSFGLSDLYKYFGECKEKLLYAPGLHKLGEQFHDAGYDAYCTGLAFIGLAHKASAGAHLHPLRHYASTHDRSNRLYVMQSPYQDGLNLAGADTEPDRSHIFFLSGFPDTWRASTITDHLTRLLQTDQFTVQLSNNQTAEAFVSFKSDYQFTDNAAITALTANQRVVLDGKECKWMSFLDSKAPPPRVLGKRDSDESVA